ncbi:assimilatory nitrate reductase catalytic subunit [Acinetobacter calcoaceticus]|uniref:Assimilatory nitrate reductase catalytic subunit n=1 Tax=Acinetobacter calcoaceticus TaxID=471 RepID=A0A4R1XYL8_ACICA|nr:assimilatory nitrate reductase catalytic subunit [Acinetobacter calcoaceticus]
MIQSTCPYCGVGCGVQCSRLSRGDPSRGDASAVQIVGDPQHPANLGKLCIKGGHLADTLDPATRVLQPMLGRGTQRQACSWDQALEQMSQQLQHCIAEYGRDSIAFYVSGQLLTEDYYVVNKFVKGYLGTANIDTNSRLCMSSAVAGHHRAFGEDLVPASYTDFEQTQMVVLVGSNTAWCHPVLYQRIMQAKAERGLFVVVVDPRYTSTCEAADLHLPILPGQDVALFNGLLQYLHQHGYSDRDFVATHTQDLSLALAASAAQADLTQLAARTGITLEALQQFYQRFAQTEKVMTLFSMGVNQSSQGVDKVNSIINCHLLSGKIGKPGSAPFSMTGQPNAMGGREVGGLANMLAAHLALENPEHRQLVQNFWQSPHIASKAGLKAVDLFQAVEAKQIKFLWIMATNPVVSLPDAEQVKRALAQCEYVVVSEVCQDTDSSAYADVLLPALAWGEKEGTVTNSERRISRQRAFMAAAGAAKADWWALCQVAKRLGFQGFDFENSHQIFVEHARLSCEQNSDLNQRQQVAHFRYFNLAGLRDLSLAQYQNLAPIQWPVWQQDQQPNQVAQLFQHGQFSHADGKARFIATVAADPKHPRTDTYPLILNTGRLRDQWHSMTRTGLSANLSQHRAVAECEIHPLDALKYAVQEHGLIRLTSTWGSAIYRLKLSDGIRRGQVFVPIHWSDQFASDARIGKVVNPVVDPISGEPEFKHTPVSIQAFYSEWQAVLYLRHGYEHRAQHLIQQSVWWNKITTAHATRYELADRRPLHQLRATIKQLLQFEDESYEWLNLDDPSAQIVHIVILQQHQLMACLYIAAPELLPDRAWLAGLFKRQRLSAQHRKALLAGAAMTAQAADGPLLCSCFKVGKQRIVEAIRTQQLQDEKQVTACLKVGGNCGSCLPEIRGLIKMCQLEDTVASAATTASAQSAVV